MQDEATFYRFDGYGDSYLQMEEHYELKKETPCGYWIGSKWDDNKRWFKWVSKTSRKRFAYPDRDQAWESYIARKKKQQEHLVRMLKSVDRVIEYTRGLDIGEPPTTNELESNHIIW